MRLRPFTPDERRLLENNPNVLKVANSNIIYTDQFKQLAVDKHKRGVPPNAVFTEAGIDLSIFPAGYARYAIKRWKTKGVSPEASRKNSGRPKNTANMTNEELLARVAYLEAENDFLKKLRALEEEG